NANATPWPYPQSLLSAFTYYSVDANNFKFLLKDTKLEQCDILKHAIPRYEKLIFLNDCSRLDEFSFEKSMNTVKEPSVDYNRNVNYLGELMNLTIEVRHKCESMPHADMDEMYTLRLNSPDFPDQAFLFANNVWGALRGLETFSQLIYRIDGKFYVNTTFIVDFPRFSHRGFLIDTSRHYISTKKIFEHLDAMAYNKLNVFHWHIVDDQSFPYVSTKFPDLSKKGAFRQTHIYTPKDVSAVIEYARRLGIRVMVEFDTPGHSQSWGKGQEDLLTKCYSGNKTTGEYGPIDPTLPKTYKFLEKFFAEVSKVFPEKYIHLGGDEVSFQCWQSNPKITEFMKMMGFDTDYAKLENYYMQRVVDMNAKLNKSSVVWQEVYDNGVDLQKDTIVHVWLGDTAAAYHEELRKVTKSGYRAILSSPWYISNIQFGNDWQKYYDDDPQAFDAPEQQKRLIIGGEICMWGEYVDGTNLISRSWPRASPVAERLWSPDHVKNIKDAIPRLERMRCSMLQRGIRVEPVNGPGTFCNCDYAV
ncbi:beta-hexosaminidase subunit alpha-like protein, partial [Leptotrombidium deliense]